MSKIGKLAADGTTETEADVCAITGRDVLGKHSIQQRITGTPYFYRFLSDFQYKLTDELRAAIEAEIPQETIAPTTKKGRAQETQSEPISIEKE